MPSYDAIVVGAGTNGLACACRLQKTGRRVLLVESHDAAGGGAAARQALAPDVSAPALAHLVTRLDARVERGMRLGDYGLAWHSTALPTTLLSIDGEHVVIDGAAPAKISGPVTADDRLAWERLCKRLMLYAGKLSAFTAMPPPRLARHAGNDWMSLVKIGLALRLMGKAELREFMRLLLINVFDVAEDELQHPLLKGLLAFDATLGTWLGPRSPNSLLLLLNRWAGEIGGRQAALGLPRGGVASVAQAMAKATAAAGAEIRLKARVKRITVESGRATGVDLEGGETLRAPLVACAISPKTALLDLVGHALLDTGLVRRLRNQKSRGAAAKLHLVLKEAPHFMGANPRSRLVIAPSPQDVELAYNPVKYGDVPQRPVMEIVMLTAFEEARDPQRNHAVSAIVQYAPHAPAMGEDSARQAMLEASLAQIERHSPGFTQLVTRAEMLMPYDIERSYGLVGGNWHHGELSVEQMLFLRPVPGMAHYATPIDGLWLASAGCHPGGGISGSAGWNAAAAIIKSQR